MQCVPYWHSCISARKLVRIGLYEECVIELQPSSQFFQWKGLKYVNFSHQAKTGLGANYALRMNPCQNTLAPFSFKTGVETIGARSSPNVTHHFLSVNFPWPDWFSVLEGAGICLHAFAHYRRFPLILTAANPKGAGKGIICLFTSAAKMFISMAVKCLYFPGKGKMNSLGWRSEFPSSGTWQDGFKKKNTVISSTV